MIVNIFTYSCQWGGLRKEFREKLAQSHSSLRRDQPAVFNIISGEERDFSAKTALILAACKILSIRATEVNKYRDISSEAQSFEADICIKGTP